MSDDFHSFIEAVVQMCPVKKVFLEISQNSQENTCASLFFNKVAGGASNFIKKENLAQVFSCGFCKISKNTFFDRTPLVATFIHLLKIFCAAFESKSGDWWKLL